MLNKLLFCTIFSKSEFIFTLGSSAGFEALAIGKPVVNFGKIYYDAFEGVINVSSFEQLYSLLRSDEITNFPKADIIHFVAKIYAKMKKGNPFLHDSLLSEDNLEAISTSIEEELLSRHA